MRELDFVTRAEFTEFRNDHRQAEERTWKSIASSNDTIVATNVVVNEIATNLALHLEQSKLNDEQEQRWKSRVFLVTLAAVSAAFTAVVSISLAAAGILPAVIN